MNQALETVLFIILIIISAIAYHFLRISEPEPGSREIYSDLSSGGKVLVSRRYMISGKPDMILKKRDAIIPFEYKTTNADKPRTGHLLQMAAYFLILEENFPGMNIDYGIIEYKKQKFRIKNTVELRRKLLSTLAEMRQFRPGTPRNHHNPGKCFRCSFKDSCLQNLITQKQ